MEAVMGNLFAGLESLGLNIKDNVDVYEKEKKENQSAGVKKAQVKEIQEEDLLFDKTYTCPVCDLDLITGFQMANPCIEK